MRLVAIALDDLQQQTLEVLTFGEGCVHGMVHGLSEAFNDLNAPMGIGGGVGDNLLEQIHLHEAGTAESGEHAALGQKLHRKEVDVLVAPGALLQVVLAFFKG